MFKREHTGDTTNISFTVSGDTISYTITNPSERTQYLLNNGLLGLGLFVHENDVYISDKWRSDLSKRNHAHRRCIYLVRITSLTGTLNLNTIYGSWWRGALSRALGRIFNLASSYEDPYRSEGYENIALGIGRCNPAFIGTNKMFRDFFRPHRVSDEVEIQVTNRI